MKRFVLVTTAKKGVFAGFLEAEDGDSVDLTEARMCIYWPSECRGVLGLASVGPLKGARISPAVPSATLGHVTGIFDCTEEARALWEAEPWS